jgi:hypothetical protein
LKSSERVVGTAGAPEIDPISLNGKSCGYGTGVGAPVGNCPTSRIVVQRLVVELNWREFQSYTPRIPLYVTEGAKCAADAANRGVPVYPVVTSGKD